MLSINQLRVTISLARLPERQGRRDEERAMVAEIYGRFIEGFDSADPKDANALLDPSRSTYCSIMSAQRGPPDPLELGSSNNLKNL
jgi:hypothetical protein